MQLDSGAGGNGPGAGAGGGPAQRINNNIDFKGRGVGDLDHTAYGGSAVTFYSHRLHTRPVQTPSPTHMHAHARTHTHAHRGLYPAISTCTVSGVRTVMCLVRCTDTWRRCRHWSDLTVWAIETAILLSGHSHAILHTPFARNTLDSVYDHYHYFVQVAYTTTLHRNRASECECSGSQPIFLQGWMN